MPDNFYKEDPKVEKKKTMGKQTSTSVRRTAMTVQSDDSSEDEEVNEMIGDRDPREKLLSERRLEKRERESYKHSFLTKLMEKYEDGEEEKKGPTKSNNFRAQQSPPKSIMKKQSILKPAGSMTVSQAIDLSVGDIN